MKDQMKNWQQMTFGKKLMIAFGMMCVATLALGIAAWTGINSLQDELDFAANKTEKKLKLIGRAATDIAEMRSYERGVLVRLAMKDKTKAAEYHSSFSETAKRLHGEMEELKLLAIRNETKQDIQAVESKQRLGCPSMRNSGGPV